MGVPEMPVTDAARRAPRDYRRGAVASNLIRGVGADARRTGGEGRFAPSWIQLLHPVATVIAKSKLLVLPAYPAAWPQADGIRTYRL